MVLAGHSGGRWLLAARAARSRLHALHDPPTYHGGVRRETLVAIRKAWPEAPAGLDGGRPDRPVLFVHGAADPVVPVADPRAGAAQLPRATVTFAGDLHALPNESDRDRVHDAVAVFVTATVGGTTTGSGEETDR